MHRKVSGGIYPQLIVLGPLHDDWKGMGPRGGPQKGLIALYFSPRVFLYYSSDSKLMVLKKRKQAIRHFAVAEKHPLGVHCKPHGPLCSWRKATVNLTSLSS